MRISQEFAGTKVTYGIEHDAQYRATAVTERGLLGTRFTVRAEGEDRDFELLLPGRHNLSNLLAAIATARVAGISWDGIANGIAELKPAYHRGVVVPYRGATIYDDTYNSNPYALASALTLLKQADATRRIAIIGDMLELGERELEYHRESGRAIPQEVDAVIAVGRRAKSLLDGAREAGFADDKLHHFDDAQSAGEFLKDFIREGDLVLIKASRGIGLDKIVTMLEGGAH
jgi:UDP-N-acetylmuramoyl-tripeptide--D-alanyl-D-alanine ligase